MPAPGLVRALSVPGGPGVRDDRGVAPGFEIPVFYDSMISKLIVWDDTRDAAIARLRRVARRVPRRRREDHRAVLPVAHAPLWLSACVMQYALGPAGVTVTVVELPPLAQPADVCVTLPALEPLHTRLRIDEAASSRPRAARFRWAATTSMPVGRRHRSFMRMARMAHASTRRNFCRTGCSRVARA